MNITKLKKNNKNKLFYLDIVDNMLYKKNLHKHKLDKIKKIILKYIIKYIKPGQTIVEIGCGYGSIGLYLMQNINFLKNKFIFLDIANNGTKLLKIIANDLGIKSKKFETGYIDSYNCSIDKNINIPKNSFFFSHSSMHYKKKHNSKFIDFFLNLKFKNILFAEPIIEHNLKNYATVNYIKKNNYSENFLEILQKNPKIRIILEKKNVYKIKLLPYSIIGIKRI